MTHHVTNHAGLCHVSHLSLFCDTFSTHIGNVVVTSPIMYINQLWYPHSTLEMYPVDLVTEGLAQWLSLSLLALQASLSPGEPIVTVHDSFPFSKKNIYTLKNIERKGPSITLILESTPKYSKRILIFSTQYILVFFHIPQNFPHFIHNQYSCNQSPPQFVSFITQQPVGIFASGFLHSISFLSSFRNNCLQGWHHKIAGNKIHTSTCPSICFNILFNFDISRLISNNGFSISTPGSYDSGGFHERDHCKSSSLWLKP